jgi:hypothetical protein
MLASRRPLEGDDGGRLDPEAAERGSEGVGQLVLDHGTVLV